MEEKTLSAIIHYEDSLYVAECPGVETVSQGKTIKEALDNLREATELYLEEFPVSCDQKPFLTTFQVKVGTHS